MYISISSNSFLSKKNKVNSPWITNLLKRTSCEYELDTWNTTKNEFWDRIYYFFYQKRTILENIHDFYEAQELDIEMNL